MAKWVKVKQDGTILEDNGDGTYTYWAPSAWGPIGTCGQLKPGLEAVPVTKADQKKVDRIERMIERSLKMQAALARSMGINI